MPRRLLLARPCQILLWFSLLQRLDELSLLLGKKEDELAAA